MHTHAQAGRQAGIQEQTDRHTYSIQLRSNQPAKELPLVADAAQDDNAPRCDDTSAFANERDYSAESLSLSPKCMLAGQRRGGAVRVFLLRVRLCEYCMAGFSSNTFLLIVHDLMVPNFLSLNRK